jgi:integrase/recombinase XerD
MPMTYPLWDPRHALRFAEWPEQDLAFWRQIVRPADVLDDGGLLAGLAPGTLLDHKVNYGHWLGFCVAVEPQILVHTPSARITPSRVQAYVVHLRSCVAPYTALGRMRTLARIAAAIAAVDDWVWLRRIVARLEATAGPIKPKLPLIRPIGELIEAGVRLMKEAEVSRSSTARMPAVRFRDGLMLATLAARPLRAGNFTALTVGQHLYSAGGEWAINIAGSETKDGREYAVPYPAMLVPYLEQYLDHWRPELLVGAEDSNRLWLSWRGYPLDYQDVHRTIRTVTAKLFGIPMHPHIFRDCLATCVALNDPVNMGIASALLGHRWLERPLIGSTIRPD